MEIIDAIKRKFQIWFLIQRDKYLKNELATIPSDNPDDYYFDNLTNSFIYKDSSLNIQIGWQNTLNVVKTQIESVNISVEKLEAIIDDIAQVNIDTTALTAIISNIATVNANITNLQAIITDIASMNVNVNNLQAIISNIATVNANITNLQAIITDIANIETLNTTISGNITSLTAIIANIGTMNTNITNLQAIIADIANIETQNISMSTALATINTNIATINTAITSIEAHQVDIDINIANVNDLNIDISEQVNKSISYSGTIAISSMQYIGTINSEYLFNALSIVMKANDTNNSNFIIYLREVNNVEFLRFTIINNKVMYFNDYYFPSTKYVKIYIENISSTATLDYSLNFYYTQQTRDNSFANKCLLGVSETQTYYFTDITFLNRLSYIFQHGSTSQSYTIKVYSMLKASGATYYAKLIDTTITGSASEVLSGVLSFPETTDLKVEIIENLGYASYAELNLFFSKNLKPELDEHIETSNIHFLESSINLANINEKLHASLTEVSASQHHIKTVASELNLADLNEKSYNSLTDKPNIPSFPIGAKIDYFGTGIKGTITTRDYEISITNGDDFDMLGWFVANGQHTTPNCIDKFIRNEATSGVVGGSDNAVVVSHSHTVPSRYGGAYSEGYANNSTINSGLMIINTSSEGVSGVDKNIPAKISAIPIIKMS